MLAVALGIGVAAPAVATADAADDSAADASADASDTSDAGTDSSDTTSTDNASAEDADSEETAEASEDVASTSSTTSKISVGKAPPVVVSSSGGAHSSADNADQASEPVTDAPEGDSNDGSQDEAETNKSGMDPAAAANPTNRQARGVPHARNGSERMGSPETTVSSNTVVTRSGEESTQLQEPDQVASLTPAPASAPTSTAVPTAVATAAPPSAAPTPSPSDETTSLRTALFAVLGGLGNDPTTPVGTPVFDALVASYRRIEARQAAEPMLVAEPTATTEVDGTVDPAAAQTLLAAAAVATEAGTADDGTSVDYAVTSDWGSGFVAAVTVTAGDSDLDGWTVEFDSPAEITNIWSGVITSHVDDHYVVQNAEWNGTVAAGQSVAFGFQAAGTSSDVSNVVINGKAVGGEPQPQPPSLSIADASVSEGASGTTQLDFVVTLSEASADTVTVDYATANGTATAAEDYVATSGTLTFAPGQTSQQVTIDVLGDTTVEGNETLTLNLSNPAGATLTDATATGVITNDDDEQTPSTGDASVDYAVTSDWGSGFVAAVTVTAGESGLDGWTVEFDSPAEITGIWSGEIVSHVGDHYVVQNADWNGTVAAGQSVAFGFQAAGTSSDVSNFVINGNAVGGDPEPQLSSLSISDATVTEGDSGTSQLDFVVTLSEASTEAVTVGYATTNGTATAGQDYVAASGTLTFAPGQTSQQVTIDVLGDATVEGNETLTLTLSNASGATITDAAATGVIINDDAIESQWGEAVFAPYVDMGAYPVPDLVALSETYGASFFNLGFMQADPNNELAWAALSALEPASEHEQAQAINASIAEFQAAGGKVAVSLGGVANTTIAERYVDLGLSAQALADEYQSVIDFYNLDRIDFDVEAAAVSDQASVDLRNEALAIVQQNNPDLEIWYTLPVLPTGLTADGLNVVQSALEAGVQVDGVNVMAMDYGEGPAPTTGPNAQTMGAYAIESAESTYDQLTTLYADYGQEFTWSQLGVTPMIGVNDITTEVFTVDDAQALLDFANEKGLGMISFWSVARDNPGDIGQATDDTSGTDAPAGAYSDIFNDYGTPNDVDTGGGTDNGGGTGTDTTAQLSVSNSSVAETDSGTTELVFDVTISAPVDGVVTVNYRTEGFNATAGTDYETTQGVLTFSAGETSQQVRVNVIGDTAYETTESLFLVLSDASGAVIADDLGAGLIGNNDANPSSVDPQYRVVGYFAEWGIYDRAYDVADIPADELTHISYAFFNIDDDGEVALYDEWAATQVAYAGDWANTPVRGNLHQLALLKAENPDLQTLMSVGGWTLSDKFSDVALTEESREKFAASAIDAMITYGFDGIDIDWEYPVSGGLPDNTYRPEDGANYVLLVEEIRRQLDELEATDGIDKHYLLTIAAPAGSDKIANFDLAGMDPYLDWFNVMTYDFHGPWDAQTGHLSPLYSTTETAGDPYYTDYAIDLYLDVIDPSKIVLGSPMYGRSVDGVTDTDGDGGLYESFDGEAPGVFEDGVVDYWVLMNLIEQQPDVYQVYWDDEAKASYVYAPDVNGGTFISYESLQSLQYKLDYLESLGLGGIMFWELDADVRDVNDDQSLLGLAAEELNGQQEDTV